MIDPVERANRIAAQLSRDPKIQKIVGDAKMFDSLRGDPGWQRLYELVRAKRDRWMTQIMNRFMGPEKNWPQPTEIAYHQGFYQGAIYVLAHPEHAEESLERAARLAWAMTLDDDDTEEG